MGGRRRILTVFGARPEAIKLFPLIHALQSDARFERRVCVSGQHRSMLDQVLRIVSMVAALLCAPTETAGRGTAV